MLVIDCTIRVAVKHDDTPQATIKANNALLSLFRRAQKLGKTSWVTHSGNNAEPGSAPQPADPVADSGGANMQRAAAAPDHDFDKVADVAEGSLPKTAAG